MWHFFECHPPFYSPYKNRVTFKNVIHSIDQSDNRKLTWGIIIIGYRLNMAKYARQGSLSGTADRACEVCFCSKTKGGHISPYSVYNLFFTYFTTKFTFWKLSYCNLKYLKYSTLSETLVECSKFVWKRSRIDFIESKQQANIAGKQCLYTGIKRPLMATANAVHELFLAVVSICSTTFIIYTYLERYNATNLRFLYAKKL